MFKTLKNIFKTVIGDLSTENCNQQENCTEVLCENNCLNHYQNENIPNRPNLPKNDIPVPISINQNLDDILPITNTRDPKIAPSMMKPSFDNEPVILTLSSDEDDEDSDSLKNGLEKKAPNLQPPPRLIDKEPIISLHMTSKHFFRSNAKCQGSYFDTANSYGKNVPDPVSLQCRNVRIGSYKAEPSDKRIQFLYKGFQIAVPPIRNEKFGNGSSVNEDYPDKTPVTLTINMDSILKVLAHFESAFPVIYIYLLPQAAKKIRDQLNMVNRNGFYFDPCSHEESQRRLVLMPERWRGDTINQLQQIFNLQIYARNSHNTEGNPLLEELTLGEANKITKLSTPLEPPANLNRPSANNKATDCATMIIYPPPPNKGGITVTISDYSCLQEEEFLNDVLIDFYLKWLMLNDLSDVDKERTHVFSSFFYRRLTSKPKTNRRSSFCQDEDSDPATRRHNRVKSWTKNVDIFEKDFLLVPINERSHWLLAVICFPGLDGAVSAQTGHSLSRPKHSEGSRKSARKKRRFETIPLDDDEDYFSERDEAEADDDELLSGDEEPPSKRLKKDSIQQPCILIFDSMPTRSRSRIVATLRQYLWAEHRTKKTAAKEFTNESIPGIIPCVPLQCNYSDCGIFVLQFAEDFFKKPIFDFDFPLPSLSDWFSQEEVSKKRESIARLIRDLMNQLNPDNKVSIPSLEFPQMGAEISNKEKEIKKEILHKINKNAMRKNKHKSRLSRSLNQDKIPGICDEEGPKIPGLGGCDETSQIPGLGDSPSSSTSLFLKAAPVFQKKMSKQTSSSSGDKMPPESVVSSSHKYVSKSKFWTRNKTVTPGYVNRLKKSKALHSVFNQSSSLKMLAESYDNSDGSDDDQ